MSRIKNIGSNSIIKSNRGIYIHRGNISMSSHLLIIIHKDIKEARAISNLNNRIIAILIIEEGVGIEQEVVAKLKVIIKSRLSNIRRRKIRI
jgi:hypothetical protein